MDVQPQSTRFIGEPIEVWFDAKPAVEKRPHCPDGFVWQEERLEIVDLLSERVEYKRSGRMRQNMRPSNALRAASTGSWGVGRFYFRVLIGSGEIFELYYDRAPKDVDSRKGGWFLYRQLIEE